MIFADGIGVSTNIFEPSEIELRCEQVNELFSLLFSLNWYFFGILWIQNKTKTDTLSKICKMKTKEYEEKTTIEEFEHPAKWVKKRIETTWKTKLKLPTNRIRLHIEITMIPTKSQVTLSYIIIIGFTFAPCLFLSSKTRIFRFHALSSWQWSLRDELKYKNLTWFKNQNTLSMRILLIRLLLFGFN